jgi:uncharacterized protein with HEPN domain
MKDEIKKYLYDIQVAINSIFDYLKSVKNLKQYENNKLVRRAVEREFEIIGEAINKILEIDKDIPIKNALRIVDLRNWVIHGYDRVDNKIIWGIMSKDLPLLKKEIELLFNL